MVAERRKSRKVRWRREGPHGEGKPLPSALRGISPQGQSKWHMAKIPPLRLASLGASPPEGVEDGRSAWLPSSPSRSGGEVSRQSRDGEGVVSSSDLNASTTQATSRGSTPFSASRRAASRQPAKSVSAASDTVKAARGRLAVCTVRTASVVRRGSSRAGGHRRSVRLATSLRRG